MLLKTPNRACAQATLSSGFVGATLGPEECSVAMAVGTAEKAKAAAPL